MPYYDPERIVAAYVKRAESGLLPPRIEKLWGQSHRVRPAYCAEKLGDGKLLLLVTPIYYRPAYYLIYGDSSWLDPETKKLVDDFVYLHGDDVTNTLEEVFGYAHYTNDAGREVIGEWPMVNLDDGYEFCLGDEAEDFFTPYQFRKINRGDLPIA